MAVARTENPGLSRFVLPVAGLIGLVLEKLVFQRIERFTVVRWGMMT